MSESERLWIERLSFYMKDLSKEEAIKVIRHVQWVKWQAIQEEADEIIKQIETHHD